MNVTLVIPDHGLRLDRNFGEHVQQTQDRLPRRSLLLNPGLEACGDRG